MKKNKLTFKFFGSTFNLGTSTIEHNILRTCNSDMVDVIVFKVSGFIFIPNADD